MSKGGKREKLEGIDKKVKICSKCPLHKTRKFPVIGEGNINAKFMLVGLGPGYNENLQGRPFVGAAGKFLDELLELAGLKREDIYITNVIKCYLPDNNPTKEEIEACSSYLDRQIEIIKPDIIITLGNISTTYIFQKYGLEPHSMGDVHGSVFRISNLLQTKIIPMYHPASALYNPDMKEGLREDWKNLMNVVQV